MFLYPADKKPFDTERVREVLHRRGFTDIRQTSNAAIEADFEYGQASTSIDLAPDGSTISIPNFGEVSLRAALALRESHDSTLVLIDEEEEFTVSLDPGKSIDDLLTETDL